MRHKPTCYVASAVVWGIRGLVMLFVLLGSGLFVITVTSMWDGWATLGREVLKFVAALAVVVGVVLLYRWASEANP